MSINLFANPYYDDFDPSKNFHQILFRPGYSVQSRELTQLQSILRDQIKKFGNHIFRHGSVVIPGNINTDENICYVKLTGNIMQTGGVVAATSTSMIGLDVTDASTGLKGKIRYYIAAEGSDPATLYVSYYNTGSGGEQVFGASKTLTISGHVSPTTASSDVTGASVMAFLNAGVFYINGTFVSVEKQSIVVEKYSATPSKHVLLKITESIVDSEDDPSLYDPAQGSYNYAAPGADRLKITLTLTTLALGSTFSADDYVELIRYNNGLKEEHSRYPKYSEIEKTLARRTYEESGDYVVNGLDLTTIEHLKQDLNDGFYTATSTPPGDESKFIYKLSPGKAYIQGFEADKSGTTMVTADKARTTGVMSANIVPSYGQYLFVTNLQGLPDFSTRETISLYSHSGGTLVSNTVRVVSCDFHESGATTATAIYRLYITNADAFDVTSVGYATWTGGNCQVLNQLNITANSSSDFVAADVLYIAGVATATAVHKSDRSTSTMYIRRTAAGGTFPTVGSIVTNTGGTVSSKVNTISGMGIGLDDSLIFKLPSDYVQSATNSGTTDISYKTFYNTTVLTNAGGSGSFSVSNMTIDTNDVTNFIAVTAGGVHATGISVAGNGLSATITGAASTTYYISCSVTKSGSQAQRKTKTYVNVTGGTFTAASTVALNVYDVIRVTSIRVGSATGEDVTSKYTLDNGQRDYAYLFASLTWNSTDPVPSGTLYIDYAYFTHGTGDYFDAQSYTSSTMPNAATSPALVYNSPTGKSYSLRNCLDYRPRAATVGGTFSGLFGALINDQRITTSVTAYLARKDAIVIGKDSSIYAIAGTPSFNPQLPTIPSDVMHLYTANVHPYTIRASDIKFDKINNRGYTMKDVGVIEQRLSNLEDYVTLSNVENDTINYNVTDPTTGLSRFKSGYLIDTFDNADSISDIANPNFKAMYVSETIVPWFEINEEKLTTTTSTLQQTGNALTLPYTEVSFAKQPLSSRVSNVNPFSAFNWNGTVRLTPSQDTWIEIDNLQTIVNNTTEVVTVTIPWWTGW